MKSHVYIFAILFAAGLCATEADPAKEFERVGIPFITKHCVECHGDKDPKGELSLNVYKNEKTVLNGRKLWYKALTLIGNGEMPPDKKPRPANDEIAAFTKSINAIFDKADKNTKPDPGHIAMRRLNRVEYNNTLRDLVFCDFNAAEDLPNDEVGHGFDNISDVQWFSPVLMERYLSAAEAVAQRVITPEPAKPPQHWQGGRYLEPAGPDVGEAKYRLISGEKPDPQHSGPLHNAYQVRSDGEYIFKTHLYAEAPAGQTVKVAILACGTSVPKPATDAEVATLHGAAAKALRPYQIMQIVEVKGRTEKTADWIEVKLPPDMGLQRMAVAIVKPDGSKPIPKLFVENFNLTGPLDTRPLFQRKYLTLPSEKPKGEFIREFLTSFATKAYRRPATPAEIDRLMHIVLEVEERSEKWEAGVQLAIQSILASPKFLFRAELENKTDKKEAVPLNDYELASRLSYFIWSTMPDDELFALAAKNQLSPTLESQVRRMLKDPKSRALVDNFAVQWLQLKRLNIVAPDAKMFPQFTPKLRASMMEETTRFIDTIIREDRSVLDLIDGKFTFLNEELAQLYGITDTNGNRAGQKPVAAKGEPLKGREFRRVDLTPTERGGILTQASILTVTSNPTRTSPVKRGKWVLDQLLGTPPPPPPPDVPDLEKGVLKGTLRQRMEQHRVNPNCASCHARMDPIGFAFENFDAIGAFRAKDEGQVIDPSGTLPTGQTFKGPTELKSILKEKKDQFSRCLTEKMMIYSLGRGLEMYDRRSMNHIQEALAQNGYKFSSLVVEIAKSEPFRLRRGKEETK
jgi:hypothetical protein